MKEKSDKMDIPSSSEEQMEEGQRPSESLSFRPHSEKTIFAEKPIFKEKKIIINVPFPQTFAENQTLMMKDLYSLSRTYIIYVDFSGIYYKINYLQGSSPQEIRHQYDFGAINSIYVTSPDFPEISDLPYWIITGARDCYLNNPTITPKDILVLTFLSARTDFYEDKCNNPKFGNK